MTLVDANILMYAAGREHPHKKKSVAFLERVANGKVAAALDAEVLREILHRYHSLGRWTEGRAVYDTARIVFPEVIPVTAEVMDRARHLMDQHATLLARDAVHAAVVQVQGLASICSYDGDFDQIKGLRRIQP